MSSPSQPNNSQLSSPQMSLDSKIAWVPVNSAPKNKRPRMSKPKVKTGCRTCKIRRVKCDETKPSCRRCLKFNGECDGYEVDISRAASKIIMPKPLASIAPKLIPSTLSALPSPTSRRELWPQAFPDEPEQRYFRFFHENTISRLSGYLDEALWNRLVLQACDIEPSIRHAVIAIGALDMALRSREATPNRPTSSSRDQASMDGTASSHYHFALQQYAEATKRMREALSQPRRDMRYTLIACLLFVCFETFHNNNHGTLDEAQSGLKLVNGWLPQFAKQGVLPRDYINGPRSPGPYVIEDELIHAFARLDIAILSSEGPGAAQSKLVPNILEVCHLMPQTFLSVEEASMYWELIWRHALHYIANGDGWSLILGLEDSEKMLTGELWEKSFHENHQISNEREEDYLNGLMKWSSAFHPLFYDAQTHADQKESAAAMSLAVQHKACHLAIAGGFSGEMYYDSQQKLFKDILSLSESLISYIKTRNNPNKAILNFERVVTGSIYMVARMCREPHTRRRAISMLESTPRRDGTWDSVLMAKVATISMEMEERAMEGHFIPEHGRIKAVKTNFNIKERTGSLRYVRCKTHPGHAKVVEEVGFSW